MMLDNLLSQNGSKQPETGGFLPKRSVSTKGMRVAIIHYWLVGMRGGEKVLESLLRMFPEAEIFTHVYVPDKVSPLIRSHKVHTTSIARLPMASRFYQKYLPMMPRALEEIDLTGFDLVISSEAGPAKGVIPPPRFSAHLLLSFTDAVSVGSVSRLS